MAPTPSVSAVPAREPSAGRVCDRSRLVERAASAVRRLRRLALAACAAAGLAAPATAQVVNHGFEDGTTQGWGPRGGVTVASSADVARTGARSLKTTGRTANWQGPALDLRPRLAPNTTYQISGYARLEAGQPTSNLKFTVEMRATGEASNSYVQVNNALPVTDGEWVLLSGTFSFTSPSNDNLTLYLESSDATSSYYLDDFTITALSAPGCPEPHDQSGLESGFETATLQGWGPRGAADLVATNEASASGNYSLQVTGREASWQGPAINVLCKMHKGSKYLISVRLRLLPGEAATSMRVSLERRFNGTTTYHTLIGNTPVTDSAWVTLQTEYTFGLDAEQMQLYVETSSGNQSFYLDDFLLMHLPSIPIEEDIPSVEEVLDDYFDVGAALEPTELVGAHGQLLLKHFDTIVAGNAMKWSSLQPTEGNFNWGPADALANFARANGLKMRGHTLIWHNQTPAWVFQDGDGNPLQVGNPGHRQLLLERMEYHIHNVVSRYADIVDSWDVVNEAIDVSQPNGLRNSPWYQIIGPEYIDWAFEFASEVAGGGKLFINDYNTHDPAKLDALYEVVVGLLDRDIPVHGVGHQTHIRIGWPSLAQIAESLDVFTALGLDNQITELDISVYSNDSDTSPVTDEQLLAQGLRYRDLFNLFRAKSDQISSVTLWGMADDNSWLKTFPITRDDKPLLFDEDLQSKWAYWGVVDPSQLPVVGQEHNITEAVGDVRIASSRDWRWDFMGSVPLTSAAGGPAASFKAMWSSGALHLFVEVADDTPTKMDAVEVFIDGQVYGFAGFGKQKRDEAVGIITPTQGGYTLQATIPVSGPLEMGDAIALDLRVMDAESGLPASWSDTTHEQEENPNNYGVLHLLPEKMIAKPRDGSPVIDGRFDNGWKKAATFKTDRFVLGSSGATATVNVVWDDNYLYVLATVTDPVLSKASANPWEEDSIEIFIDENNAQGLSYDGDDAQYRINFDNEVSGGGTTDLTKLTSATRKIAGGYVVEAAIELDPSTVQGSVIGFDIQVNDDGAGNGVRSSVATWNDSSGNAYQDPSQFGAILLK